MTSYNPPIKNAEWIGYIQLVPRTPTGQFQVNPTLASGDVKVSIDGAALANLATLPVVTPAGSTWVKISLAAAEMNGDNIAVQFIDAAGAEWCDYGRVLETVAANFDSLNTEVAAIKAKTDNLPSDPADASVIAGRFDTLDTSVADLPTSAELATALGTADDAVLAQIALVKAQTDLLPSDPADASVIAARFDTLDTSVADLPTNAELATALGTADDAVLTAIGDLPTNAELATALGTADDAVLAQVALVKAKTDSLTFTVAGQVDANIQYVNDVQVTGDGQSGTEWGP